MTYLEHISEALVRGEATNRRLAHLSALFRVPSAFDTRLAEEAARYRELIDAMGAAVDYSVQIPNITRVVAEANAFSEHWRASTGFAAFDALNREMQRQRELVLAMNDTINSATNFTRAFASIGASLATSLAPSLSAARIMEQAIQEQARWTERLRLPDLFGATVAFQDQLERLAVPDGLPFAMWPLDESNRAAQTFSVISGVTVAESDLATDTTGAPASELEGRLTLVHADLVVPFLGAVDALKSRNPDRARHVGASLRSLGEHLLERLAPDAVLNGFFPSPAEHKENGKFTRRARLQFVFREVNGGGYAMMAEQDMDLMLATFFPENAAVHRLVPTLDDRELNVLVRRVEGCISVVLAAAGY